MHPARYEEKELLGKGGFAEVRLAEDLELGREVALKRPLPEMDEPALAEFLQEARATSRLEHPGIPTVYDLGVDSQGRPYFSLQLVRGKTLEQCIAELRQGCPKAHAAYPFSQRVALFLKVCEAVAYAHERGFLHRDLKPANVMVGDLGEVFVLDWGLAKGAVQEVGPSGEYFKGTPLYAAPERVSGEPACCQSDLYSLAATLYEWLTLHPLFAEDSVGKLFVAVLQKDPKDMTSYFHPVQGRVPIELARLVQPALHKKKAGRPPDVRAFSESLRDWLNGVIQPICPCTTIKFGFRRASTWMDNFPLVAMPLVLLWLLYPALVLFQWLVDRALAFWVS